MSMGIGMKPPMATCCGADTDSQKEPLSRALRGRPFDHEDFMEILYPDVIGSGGAPKRIMKPRRRTDGQPGDEPDMPGTAETLKVDDVAGRRVSLCNDMRRLFSGDDAGCDVAPAGVLDEDVMGGSNGPSVPMGRARFLA